jgi:ornithine--oxo-acid transaminase
VGHAARLGTHLLERTRPFVDQFDVVRDVRGLGLLWAMEFAEPEHGSLAWRVMERVQTGLFAQLVVVPLFTKHRMLTQVAGYDMPVLKAIPPLVLTEQDVDDFVSALEDVVKKATRPSRVAGLALRAARAR